MRNLFFATLYLAVFLLPECFAEESLREAFPRQLQQTIQYCINKIETTNELDDTQPVNIKADCPKLYQVYDNNAITKWLGEPVDELPTVTELQNISSISKSINAKQPHAFDTDIQLLSSIATANYEPEKEATDWWSRFLKWLADFFKQHNENNNNWLTKFLDQFHMPGWLNKTIINTLLIIFAGLIITFIVLELKSAGIRNWFRRRKVAISKHHTIYSHTELTWDAISQMPENESILAGFEKLVGYLRNHNVIQSDASKTNQELVQQVQGKLNKPFTAFFSKLCNTVDAIVYGNKHLSAQESNALFLNLREQSETLQNFVNQ